MSRSIFNIDSRPTLRQVWKQKKYVAFLLSLDPAAAVKKNQRRSRVGPVIGEIKIEFQLDVICFCIGDVWNDLIVTGCVIDPAIRIGLAVCSPQITQIKKRICVICGLLFFVIQLRNPDASRNATGATGSARTAT